MASLLQNIELLEQKAELLKGMGHPIRLSIIQLLSQYNQLSVTEVYTQLHIEQAVASHHLRIMKNCGLVKANKDGKNILYSIAHPNIKSMHQLLSTM